MALKCNEIRLKQAHRGGFGTLAGCTSLTMNDFRAGGTSACSRINLYFSICKSLFIACHCWSDLVLQ